MLDAVHTEAGKEPTCLQRCEGPSAIPLLYSARRPRPRNNHLITSTIVAGRRQKILAWYSALSKAPSAAIARRNSPAHLSLALAVHCSMTIHAALRAPLTEQGSRCKIRSERFVFPYTDPTWKRKAVSQYRRCDGGYAARHALRRIQRYVSSST